jgi:hypothetical protein
MLLILVFVAEYIVFDLSDARHVPAIVGLTAVSFALYLILIIAVRAAGLRLYLLLPALVIPIGLVSLRTLYLRLGGRWCLGWALPSHCDHRTNCCRFALLAAQSTAPMAFDCWVPLTRSPAWLDRLKKDVPGEPCGLNRLSC